MKTYCFLIAFLLMVHTFSLVKCFAENDDSGGNDFQHCVCVPYFQCKEDYSGLIEEGVDVMDGIDVRSRILEIRAGTNQEVCGDLDVCCQIECGKRINIISEVMVNRISLDEEEEDDDDYDVFGFRILGDRVTEFAEFPWMLGILEGKTYRCGASLIHPQVAITAAHCVSGKGPFTIRAGEWNWETNTEPLPHQDKRARKIIPHPHYHAPSLRNDIALIVLESPFTLTRNVGLACLPFRGVQIDERRCIATGWGKNSYRKGSYQSTLKKVQLPIVPNRKCLKSLQDARLGPHFALHRSFLCAGGEKDKDTCKGDGGSPLVCPVAGRPGKYQQVGVVSWGLTCGLHDTPGVYVNVAMFVDWIDFTMFVLGLDSRVYKV
ncbi:unnamed protein product [Phaedon cochleariae]|uniref:Phenoloxidase-activating factor 2 n=1 Tax=Phaedon cochleariae TaxID=80249 RepID=A0A9N9X357_PHACE|nr:unnamed protein product [Phaedon cochleariae]